MNQISKSLDIKASHVPPTPKLGALVEKTYLLLLQEVKVSSRPDRKTGKILPVVALIFFIPEIGITISRTFNLIEWTIEGVSPCNEYLSAILGEKDSLTLRRDHHALKQSLISSAAGRVFAGEIINKVGDHSDIISFWEAQEGGAV